MKQTIFLVLSLFAVGGLFAHNIGEIKMVNVEQSSVEWKGYKVTGSHEGIIHLKMGELEFESGLLSGGKFLVDMTTISSTDLDGNGKAKLDGHLKADDFFGVDKYPTTQLIFTSVEVKGKNIYTVTGNLTIKDQTHPITFDLSVYENKASATLKIDRSKYGIKYKSKSFFENLGDKVIYDEFDINVNLVF